MAGNWEAAFNAQCKIRQSHVKDNRDKARGTHHIVTQATASKIVNKGGGAYRKRLGGNRRNHRAGRQTEVIKDTGTDYVVFECKACGKRNKQCVYDVRYQISDGDLVFGCNGCGRDVELKKPQPAIATTDKSDSLIVTPQQYQRARKGNEQSSQIIRA